MEHDQEDIHEGRRSLLPDALNFAHGGIRKVEQALRALSHAPVWNADHVHDGKYFLGPLGRWWVFYTHIAIVPLLALISSCISLALVSALTFVKSSRLCSELASSRKRS